MDFSTAAGIIRRAYGTDPESMDISELENRLSQMRRLQVETAGTDDEGEVIKALKAVINLRKGKAA